MATFRVGRLANNEDAKHNSLFFNKLDFAGGTPLYLKLNNEVVYPAVPREVDRGFVCCGRCVRAGLNRDLGDEVQVSVYQAKQKSVRMLSLELSLVLDKKSVVISEHEQNLQERIARELSNHYFYSGQRLLLQDKKKDYIVTVISTDEGFLSEKTRMELSSSDDHLTIVGSRLLKRELFRDDYSFQQIGIGGLDSQLGSMFRRALSTRAVDPKLRERLGVKPVKGVLLYGPPGTGKTLIARKIGSLITDREPKVVKGPEIMNKWVGQSEENIRNLFSDAMKDREGVHVIIFDEIDAICKTRSGGSVGSDVNSSVVNQLLSMIDGVQAIDNIFIIGMTNRKDLLDEALLRPGRLELHIAIGLPDAEGREQIFRIHTETLRTNGFLGKIDLKELSSKSENFSGAEIEAVVKNAVNTVLHRQLSGDSDLSEAAILVGQEELLKALSEISPAFGRNSAAISELVPSPYLTLSDSHEECLNSLLQEDSGFKRVLITSSPRKGRTSLVAKMAQEKGAKYTRMIRPIEFVGKSEAWKLQQIATDMMNAGLSDESLIVLDDIDLLMDYVRLGTVTSFSEKLYHTIVTLLRTPTSGKLLIVATCSNLEFADFISKEFDATFSLE